MKNRKIFKNKSQKDKIISNTQNKNKDMVESYIYNSECTKSQWKISY
jgi:hypothetical protein